ncbi:hypothetical protein DTO166G4_3336 [Paecilomyces variotii]|uniref:Uncharacterized protein n=1 Tax=Byssochlamys spectabilis TaxID=264951 RepID=A0A443I0X4_BYSSP|nr:hypothetical protein C8Q69DRAFT_456461 [Paecilomyces variotii]KAJ9200335.1 hypothetical protein DTO032I3_4641 [Paecilomyces variotii]KAJ9202602.1 hypothetical protein DTO164E3_3042 [Paecilomyces variotii]KAJ9215079.1 hypothetical protein DTO166G4_3336 [Paecilomyces variotii]KAJ9239080.1 hypothetical protein DTO166G5_2610 [Paecilomyces variotii]KAJ9248619.1 hypothetical protein DTO207G8_7255 [Paecilomyces variotii]
MADVRSLLRNELASRRGTSQAGPSKTRLNKKRKVDADDNITRKKLRPAGSGAARLPPDTGKVEPPSAEAFKDEELGEEEEHAGVEPPPEDTDLEARDTSDTAAAGQSNQAIDEDEWAAFEREVALPTRVPQATIPAAAAAAPTISAAPMTAEEIAAQEKQDNESIARAREAEAEGEREDAARFLEEEFDEMDQLEERVRRLKQKREELRQKKAADEEEAKALSSAPSGEQRRDQAGAESESDEDDDDWDDWRFR